MAVPVMKEGMYCHVEIPARDRAKAKKFFGDVFGWTFQSMGGMDYEIYSTGDGGVGGGLWTPDEATLPLQVVNYILVKNVDAHLERIAAAGGQIIKTKTEVPTMGWFGVFTDPEGNTFGIWEMMNPPPSPKSSSRRKPARGAAKPARSKPAARSTKAKKAPAKAKGKAKAQPKAKARSKPKAAARAAKKPARKKGRR